MKRFQSTNQWRKMITHCCWHLPIKVYKGGGCHSSRGSWSETERSKWLGFKKIWELFWNINFTWIKIHQGVLDGSIGGYNFAEKKRLQKPLTVITIGTGFALSDYRLWKQGNPQQIFYSQINQKINDLLKFQRTWPNNSAQQWLRKPNEVIT